MSDEENQKPKSDVKSQKDENTGASVNNVSLETDKYAACFMMLYGLALVILVLSVVFDVYLYIFAGKSGTCLEDIKVAGVTLASCLLVQAITLTVSLFSGIMNMVSKKMFGEGKKDERGFWANVKDASGLVSFIFSIFIIIAYNKHSSEICDDESKEFVHAIVILFYALYGLTGALLLGVCCVPCLMK